MCQWLEAHSFENYIQECRNHIKNGLQLLQMTTHDYEKVLGMKNMLHRKRLQLHLQIICNNAISNENSSTTIDNSSFYIDNLNIIDTNWITSMIKEKKINFGFISLCLINRMA